MVVPSARPGGRARFLRETYVRPENLRSRAGAWLAAIRPYTRRSFRASFQGPRPCLLLIDLQRFFLEPEAPGYLPAAEAVVPRLEELRTAFRDRGLPVFLTRHTDPPGDACSLMADWWGRPMDPEDPWCDPAAPFRPQEGEVLLEKHRYSAFRGTGLAARLREEGVSAVVVAGVMTHLCCESTARDAFQYGFPVVFPADGSADLDETLHLGSLRGLAHGFAVPVLVEEVVWALGK